MLGQALSFVTGPIGSYFDQQARKNAADHAARANYAQQKEFAQSGVQWKVEDAKKAGIHPLAALGVASPSTGGTHEVGGGGGYDLGASLSDMGQNIARGVSASSTADQRTMQQLAVQNAKLNVEGQEIENQIKRAQLNSMQAVGPAFPSANDPHMISGQGNSMPGVKITPSESVASEKGRPGIQAGLINSLQYVREADGTLGIAPSQQAKERNEDDFIAETLWHLRNRINPPPPNERDYPTGDPKKPYWFWHPMYQKFIPSKNR